MDVALAYLADVACKQLGFFGEAELPMAIDRRFAIDPLPIRDRPPAVACYQAGRLLWCAGSLAASVTFCFKLLPMQQNPTPLDKRWFNMTLVPKLS